MKRYLLFFISVLLLSSSTFSQEEPWEQQDQPVTESSTSSSSSSGFKFNGAGAGLDIGLCLAETWGMHNVDLDVAAFTMGVRGVLDFSIGKAGKFRYIPSFIFWIRKDKSDNEESTLRDNQFHINLFDFAYMPPIPESVPVKPYVGIGPSFAVHVWQYEYNPDDPSPADPTWEEDGSGLDFLFNIILGAEFPVGDILAPYAELRLCATENFAARLAVGLNILF